MKKARYLTAQEAAAELGITSATLYAYVSRGLIRSEAVSGSQRVRRYSAEDVERLKARKESRRNPDSVAETALHLGTPVLESSITLIQDGNLYYRGQDAVGLAECCSAAEVAALIWMGDLNARLSFKEKMELPAAYLKLREQIGHLTPFEHFQVMLPLAAAQDPAAYDLRPTSVAATGARILRLMVAVAAGGKSADGRIADILAGSWSGGDTHAALLINSALILCADHELNISAFTARVVASGNATPYAVVMAGLAALSGSKHGGHTERVEAFLREAGTPEGVYEAMAGRLRRGERIPGFGHVLYPDGDPRGRALLEQVAEAYPDSPALALAQATTEAAAQLIGDYPTVDFGLVILARALGLPRGAPLALFGLGRTIGWIGHAIEQYQLDRLIRPRARYTGEGPR
jgi:citrate synthase